jgi:GntR family transcriptional regulator/MocR family aminotransferase
MKRPLDEEWIIQNLVKTQYSSRIQDFIVQKIITGQLLPGDALPTHRELALLNKVNRNTVALAYNNLIAKGWLAGKSGAYTRVSLDLPGLVKPERISGFTDHFPLDLAKPTTIPVTKAGYITQPFVAVGTGVPHQAAFPFVAFNKYFLAHQAAQMSLSQAELLAGYDGKYLKQAVFDDLNKRRDFGIKPGMLDIYQDRKTCLGRLFKLLLHRRNEIVINTSAYDVVLNRVLKNRKARVLNFSFENPDFFEELEHLFKTLTVRVVYINPQCNFPERHSLNETQCGQLIALAKKYRVCIVEEEEDHEFWYGDVPYKPLAAYDHDGYLIYLATLSKATTYTQSLRLVVAPVQIINMLDALPAQSIEHREILTEMSLADMIKHGDLARYMQKMRRNAKNDRDALHLVLDNYLGKYLSYVIPEYGLMFWLEFDERLDLIVVLSQLELLGIEVPYHPNAQLSKGKHNHMLLGFGHFNMDEAEGAAKMLKEIIENGLREMN